MARRMPNASLSQSAWGGMTAPPPVARESMSGLKEYPVEQILYFHEMHLKDLKNAVGHLIKSKASENKENAGNAPVDIDMVKHLQVCSTALAEQGEKIQEQGKTIDFLRVELEKIKKQLEENVELEENIELVLEEE
jgi:hypothetical protein